MRRRLSLMFAVCTLAILETHSQDLQYGLSLHGWSSHRPKNATGRVRRHSSCPNRSEYRPAGKDYCCNKCNRGHYKKADCTGPETRTVCMECKEGTYLKIENYSPKCSSCRVCDAATFRQVTVKECTISSNTVCGCPPGMYQVRIDSDVFYCKNCTVCKIGTLSQCSGFNDTACQCQREYYYHPERKECLNCDSCDPGSQCQHLCQVVPDHSGIILTGAGVLSFASIVTIVAGLYIIYRKSKPHSVPLYQTETESSSPSELVIGKSDCSLLPVQEVSCSPLTRSHLPRSSELPDCVKIAGQSQLPNNSQVNYDIADMVPTSRWKEFVRRLGMSDRDIERSELDNRHSFREAQYQMVKLWRQKQGPKGATTEAICKVLKEMDLNDCAERLQEALQ